MSLQSMKYCPIEPRIVVFHAMTAVEVHNLHKSYRMGRVNLHVLRGVSFSVAPRQFTAVVGASGSGKSTLLHLIGLLDSPDRGKIVLDGQDTAKLPGWRKNKMRCNNIGFVFQFYHLLPELNVLENVMMPTMTGSSLVGWVARRKKARTDAREVLEQVNLGERLKHRPKELSGGERQRVAIARALINRPKLLLADEPTGNLDSKTGKQIIRTLQDCNQRLGLTILMVTHNASIAAQAQQTMHLRDGRLSGSGRT